MSLQFIFGGSGSGKTHLLYEELIRQSIARPDRQFFLLVPEQSTLQTQRELLMLHPGHGTMNIDVLSFERLAYRVFDELGVNPGVILDDLGKSLLLKKTASSSRKQLSVYGRQVGMAGFTAQMKSTLSEFYQYRLHPDQLEGLTQAAGDNTLLACKLKDLSVLFRAFEEAMDQNTITAEELLEVLASNLSRSRLIRRTVMVLDGFTGFTPVQYEVLRELIRYSPKLVVAVTIDPSAEPYSSQENYDLFYMSRVMIRRLSDLAASVNALVDQDVRISQKPPVRFALCPELAYMEEHLFRYPAVPYHGRVDHVRFYEASDRSGELDYVCREILSLVRDEGYRFRDIAVLSKDMAGFAQEAEESFAQAGIPYFVDDTRSMLSNPLVELIRAGLETVRRDFSYESIFRYAKCGFDLLPEDDLFELENYVIALGIRGAAAWNKTWDRTYRGEESINLDRINESRKQLAGPLFTLRKVLSDREAGCGRKLDAIEAWVEEVGGREKLFEMGKELEIRGSLRLAGEYAQIPDRITELFERIRGLMGEEKLSLDELSEILDTGFEEIRIGSIPPCIDRVVMGDLERTRLPGVKAVFFLGLNEGIIPSADQRSGLLTEYDREQLKQLGAELAPTAKEQGFIERFYLYLALTKASDRLYLCWSEKNDSGKAMRPSAYVTQIRKLFPDTMILRQQSQSDVSRDDCWESVINRESGRSLIACGLSGCRDHEPGPAWKEVYSCFWAEQEEREKIKKLLDAAFCGCREEKIAKSVNRILYGQKMTGSISRLENYAACAYAQFLTYGLQLQKRREYEFGAADMGNVFHQALESCFRKIEEEGLCVASLSDQKRKEIVSCCVGELAGTYGNIILDSSARNRYLAGKIARITERTLWAVGEQTKRGEMIPSEFELDFSGQDDPAMMLRLDDETDMELKGRIDRLDIYEDEDSVYVRVLDYKSGSESFDLNRIYRGLQLQLIVYLGAALDREKRLHPDKQIEPAGVFYFHIADPVIESEQMMDPETAKKQILEKLKLDGLVLADEKAVHLQDREFTGRSGVIPVIEQGGAISFSLSKTAGRRQFQRLLDHAREKMTEFGRKISDGQIPVNPYRLKKRCACDYCEYSSVCGFDPKLPGYRYRQMKVLDDSEIWRALNQDSSEGGEEDGGVDG